MMPIRRALTTLPLRLRHFAAASARIGFANAIAYAIKTKIVNRFRQRPGEGYRVGVLRSRQLHHPVLFRYRSTDIEVFSHMFVTRDEYAPLARTRDVRLVIDCGANVGYASAYLLSRFPAARVIAIEPDARNVALLRRNLEPYGARATIVPSAVWSHATGLKVCPDRRGEWTTTVRECEPGESPDVMAVGIDGVLADTGLPVIDILKVDVEGAEQVVFSRNTGGWLDRTRSIGIELHGRQCRQVFQQALAGRPYEFVESGDITIATRVDSFAAPRR